ncbi:MAG TPA: efflux RND transporter periplasmic adaptor subunit [Bacteroidales bacterium]|nr:efflux RND transporter periplasmic adaptor subunit [Bacteroidales bacterium]
MQKTIIYLIASVVFFSTACNRQPATQGHGHGHTHDVIGGHAHDDQGHDHEHGDGAMTFTLFSEGYELFVEFPALVVGQTSEFAIHITKLSNFRPVEQGSMTVSIIKGGRGIRHRVDAPTVPGIFKPALQPKEGGIYRMVFDLVVDNKTLSFVVPEIQVYADAHQAAHATIEQEHGEVLTFTKEQAWRTDFEILEVQPRPFYSVIRTSGRVKSQPQAQLAVNAQAQGAVNLMVVLGETVQRGDLLAVITGAGIENNLTLILNESKLAFERSRADYLRSKPLANRQLISQRDFLEVQLRYQQDSLRYKQISGHVSMLGLRVVAPASGFVSQINVSNGQFIESGATVATVTHKTPVIIETYVNQSDFQRVGNIFDANFRFAGGDYTINLQDINGRVVSNNAFVNEHITRIPVVFSAENNGELMPGMFLEAFLKTGRTDRALVLPLTAIVEEQGLFFVFVQRGGESFEKRQVVTGSNDGRLVEIISGITPGERIVTKGAHQVRLASLAGDLPLHGHTH